MKKYIANTIFTLLLLTLLTITNACKDKEEEPEPEPAKIEITSPAPGAMYLKNNTINITGKITAGKDIHGYEITIRNKATNAVVFTANDHAHGKEIAFNKQWINNVTADADMELEVIAILDHDGNKASSKVTFMCHDH